MRWRSLVVALAVGCKSTPQTSSGPRHACAKPLTFELCGRLPELDRNGGEVTVEIVFNGDGTQLQKAGFPLQIIVSELGTALLTSEQIRALARRTDVRQIRLPQRAYPI